jgi:prepilin-type N-terminal cleavage/methylation domain-containing protein
MKSRESRVGGFTLVEIMIVVAIIGLLATIAVPNWVRARTQSQRQACINNLRQVDGAVQQWALENKQAANAPVGVADVVPYLRDTVVCPAGGVTATFSSTYSIDYVTNKPTCRIAPADHRLPADTTE